MEELAGSKDKVQLSLATRFDSLYRTGQPHQPFLFRLPFQLFDGVPMIKLEIVGQPQLFVCVVDTGSLHLNVSAGSCNSCDGSKGSFSPNVKLNRAADEWIRYGTQHDVVKKVNHQIRFHPDGPVIPAEFYVTVERAFAESNYNVMGLLKGPECFLNHVVPDSHALHIRFRGNNGFVGAVDKAVVPHLVPRAVVEAPLLRTVTGFYVVRLTGIKVGNRKIDKVPSYILLDTGSNYSSFPSAVLDQMWRGLQNGEPLVLEIDGQPLTIASKHYTWSGTNDIMIDDDLSVLNDSVDYALLGAFSMQELAFTFLPTSLLITRPGEDDAVFHTSQR